MSEKEKLGRLTEISQLMFDQKMMVLEKAARARQSSLDRLAELDRPMEAPDLPLITAQEITMRHALWADHKRRQINEMLARQTAEWIEAREEASRAFGRNQVLNRLKGQLS
jgi:hypothetical protein